MANIGEYFRQHVSAPDRALYRHFDGGEWRDVTIGEIAALIGRWQAALAMRGLVAGDRVAICLKNGIDWVALDLAALGLGLVVVPLYVDDNADSIAWCVANAEARLLVVENTKMASEIASALKSTGNTLPTVHVLRPDARD